MQDLDHFYHLYYIVAILHYFAAILTLSGLSLFLKMFPISNTGRSGVYILATVQFLYPKLGSFFRHGVLLLPTCLLWLESPQSLCRTNSNSVFSLFDCNWGKQNNHTACWHQLHPRYRDSQQGKCLSYLDPSDCLGEVTETTNCVGSKGAASPSNPHQWGHPL